MKNWLAGATPNCSSPAYVRDNIHVSLLAKAYARFARRYQPTASPGPIPADMPRARAPSRSAWPRRCAPAWELPCPVELKKQVDFPEPRVRINTDPVDADALGWDESAAWDEMANYYRRFHAPRRS